MADNLNDVVNFVLGKAQGLLEISAYERQMLTDAIMLLHTPLSNAKSVLSDHIDRAVQIKADLAYIIYRLKDKRKVIQIPFDAEYNKYYTILTKQNRPSRQAIDAEIKFTHKELAGIADTLEEYDRFLEYLDGLLALIDLQVRNCENRRYNL